MSASMLRAGRTRAVLIALGLALCVARPALAATRNVPAEYPSIQSAIDASVNGDVVLVAPGTYLERLDFLGKAITVASAGGPDVTIVDAGPRGVDTPADLETARRLLSNS